MDVIVGNVREARLGGAGLKLRQGHNSQEDMFFIQLHDIPSQEAFRAYLTKEEMVAYCNQAVFTLNQTLSEKTKDGNR